jgi:hypothetical protein
MGSCYGQHRKRRSQKTGTDRFAVHRSDGGLLMTIRGGGEPDIWNGFKAEEENGPTARSLAADANDCIMVRILLDPPNTSLRRDWLRPTAGSPLIVLGDLAPTVWRMLPCSTLSRPSPSGSRQAASLDSTCARQRDDVAGRGEETVLWSNKETGPKCLDIEHPIQARSRPLTARSRACR